MISWRGFVALIMAVATAPGACSRKGKHDETSTQTSPAPANRRDGAPNNAPREAGAMAPPDHADEAEEHEELPTKVRLPAEVVRSAGIKTAPAGSRACRRPST